MELQVCVSSQTSFNFPTHTKKSSALQPITEHLVGNVFYRALVGKFQILDSSSREEIMYFAHPMQNQFSLMCHATSLFLMQGSSKEILKCWYFVQMKRKYKQHTYQNVHSVNLKKLYFVAQITCQPTTYVHVLSPFVCSIATTSSVMSDQDTYVGGQRRLVDQQPWRGQKHKWV